MASSFIPPLDPSSSSPSSKQRRRNAALSCAECRRYLISSFTLRSTSTNRINSHKAQVEVRIFFALSGHLRSKLISYLTGAAVSSLALAASRKAAPQSAPKVNTKQIRYPASCSLSALGSLTTGKGNRLVFSPLIMKNFNLNNTSLQFHPREYGSAS
jgi:hypothetical protein